MSPTHNGYSDPPVADNAPVADEIKYTTCYMCACRCGIKVSLRDGGIRYIEGNRRHPVNHGVLCAKGSAGIMQHYSPARLSKPLLRTGPRGSGQFREIEWDEALDTAAGWLRDIRATDPKKLAFFTGRDQSQALTGWWATQFGTPNYAAHGGFCSVNMAAGGMYTIGGSFWEFGEPDWEHAKYFMLFGVAEDHDSNPIKIGIGKLKKRGAKIVSVNPIRTGYSAVADEWIGIRPGTDGLFVFALIHELLRAGKIDRAFWRDTPTPRWLVIQDAGAADDGLFARNDGAPLSVTASGNLSPARSIQTRRRHCRRIYARRRPSRRACFHLLAGRYLDDRYSPDAVAAEIGVPASTIRRIAAELAHTAFETPVVIDRPWTDWTGRRHDTMIGRPISIHAMRGISAHSNGFHTCRALHVLQALLGAIDTPGAFRYEPPYPKSVPPAGKPAGGSTPNTPLAGPPLGFPRGPEDLLVEADGDAAAHRQGVFLGSAARRHGMMHTVIANAGRGDPYPIDTLFMYMANMGWNSAMNTAETMRDADRQGPETGGYRIPHIIYSDAYLFRDGRLRRPGAARHDLSRALGLHLAARPPDQQSPSRRRRHPPAGDQARPRRAAVPGRADRARRAPETARLRQCRTARRAIPAIADYIVHHERKPGIGPLAGWRGEDGDGSASARPIRDQLERYIENGCFWQHHLPPEARYFKHANPAYLESRDARWASSTGPEPIVLQLYSEALQKFRLAARGPRAGAAAREQRERIARLFRSAADLVRAVRGGAARRRDVPAACDHAAADGDVPFLGLAERLAAADLRPEPALRAPRTARGARSSTTTIGSG